MGYCEAGRMWGVEALAAHGDRLAVVTGDGVQLTYRELAARVAAAEGALGPGRRLVLVAASNALDPLVAYLAALHAGHPVLLTAADDRTTLDALIARFDPDVVCSPTDDQAAAGSWRVTQRRVGSAHTLHPQLALLLATSGSTGAPKLVRLSGRNLAANAVAIADYLPIRPTDRAAVSVPMHYCYGLSIVHSNLLRGAALLLSDRSVTDPQFWSTARAHRATSLHGVPYTFDLLDQVGFETMPLPHLRYITQAGGRLAPDAVRRYAALGARRGWQLYLMYGQTEATARMAYLPPELAATHPTTIGRPIPGGAFEIDTPDATGVGELIYRGPNVMLGYAQHPADLARGRTVETLRTGDLGRRRGDGLYEVTGRRSRFIKPFGRRIDLDHVERLLNEHGTAAAATGTDEQLVIAVTHHADPDQVRAELAARLHLPAARIRVLVVDELPRRSNGKLDHGAITDLARPGPRRRRCSPLHRIRPPDAGAPVRRPRSVHDAFRSVFPLADLPADATFVRLGGDSLSYVQMTVALQRVLGQLPAGWDTTPIGQLTQHPAGRRAWPRMETAALLRAVAIILVVGSHVGLFHLLGGAHLLLGVTGWAFARFTLVPGTPSPGPAVLRSIGRIAVPSALWIAAQSVTEPDVELHNALLINYLLDPAAWSYWYIETLCQTLLALAVLFTIPAVRRLERARPFAAAAALLAITLTGRLFPDTGNEFSDRLMSAHLVAWLFVLGWVIHRATTPTQRALAAGLIAVLIPSFFADPVRATIVAGGLLVLLFIPRIPVPRLALRPLGAVAGASLGIYLTHYALYPRLAPHLPPVWVLAACIATGMIAWSLIVAATRLWPTLSRVTAQHSTTPRSTAPAPRDPAPPSQVLPLRGRDRPARLDVVPTGPTPSPAD